MAPLPLVPAQLSDGDLLAEVARLAACEREATAALVALLAEVEARRLHLADGCSSLFTYCTERLRLSEHAAYHRIEAARAVRAFPVVLEHLRSGALTLTAVTRLRPHLTAENHERLLAAACGRSTREVEVLVRSIAPLPDVRPSVRKLSVTSSPRLAPGPTAAPAALTARDDGRCVATACDDRHAIASVAAATPPPSAAERLATLDSSPAPAAANGDLDLAVPRARPALSRPAAVAVLAPDRYSLRVTLSAEGHARLRRAQDLLRHTVHDADPAVVVERALALLVEQLERRKFAAKQTRTGDVHRRRPVVTTACGTPPGSAVAEGEEEHPTRRTTGATDDEGANEHPTRRSPPRAADDEGVNESLSKRTRRAADHDAEDEHPTSRMPAAAPVEPTVPGRPLPEHRAARAQTRPPPAIPAAVKRAVWARDQGRCSFSGAGGRCRETGRLEFHHRIPVADGGASSVENVQLLCAGHHACETTRWFGETAPPADGSSARGARTRSAPS